MKTKDQILGEGLYAEEIGTNIKVVSRQQALSAMNEFSKEQNINLIKSIKYVLSLLKKYEPNLESIIYPHELKKLNDIKSKLKS